MEKEMQKYHDKIKAIEVLALADLISAEQATDMLTNINLNVQAEFLEYIAKNTAHVLSCCKA